MKISKDEVGQRVSIRLRVGGTYVGMVTKVTDSATYLKLDDGTDTQVSNGMIASLQHLKVENHD